MTTVSLQLGPLAAAGFDVRRSGIRWLREDGQHCEPGEVIAYCNIGLVPHAKTQGAQQPLAEEMRDLQVAFVLRTGGRLRRSTGSSHGGFLDRIYEFQGWSPDFLIGEVVRAQHERADGESGNPLQLLYLAGRRVTEFAEGRSGLLTGWHNRSRAWWGEGSEAHGSVLCLGNCELSATMRGEQGAFLDLFGTVKGPAHVAVVPDDVIVPCARTLVEQARRTPAEADALAADFMQSFHAINRAPRPEDWLFVSCLLAALQRSPLTERYDLLTRNGLRTSVPADALIVSLGAESQVVIRHKRLGYTLSLYGFRISDAGPAVRAWLAATFEPVQPTIDDIRRDLTALIETARAHGVSTLLALNAMSTSAYETIQTFSSFERPLANVLWGVRNRESNLILHDLAREHGLAIVDVDAIVADLGAAANLPDGTHGSGRLQAEVRAEIVRILRERGVRGFDPCPVN
ncbi:MAG TPA: hypothetical protein VK433_06675 [Stellaceae bacterium]|nr:hypothetical protein [Stellaceae bacterium]